MMNKYVLDASALIALINNEVGSEKVMAALPFAIMSSVNLSECGAFLGRTGMSSNTIRSLLTGLIPESEPFDSEQAYLTAELRDLTKTKGLSLGDRACLALTKLKNLTAITTDRVWGELDCGIKIDCIG